MSAEPTVTVVPAVRIVVAGVTRVEGYQRASGLAYAEAARQLGTGSLNLCDTSDTPAGQAFTYTVRPDAVPTMTYHVEDNISGRHASRDGSFAAAVSACSALNSEPAGRGGRYGVYDRDGIRRRNPITTEGVSS